MGASTLGAQPVVATLPAWRWPAAFELITVTYAFDPAARDRSLELMAKFWF